MTICRGVGGGIGLAQTIAEGMGGDDGSAAQKLPSEGALHALAVIRAVREGLPIPGLVARERGY